MTYGQLRTAILERYKRPPIRVKQVQLEDYLADTVFRPMEVLLQRISRMERIIDDLVVVPEISSTQRTELVTEFQDVLEQIILDYQETLLHVPSETVEPTAEASRS